MQQLSNIDAAFLFLENPKTPLHVGGLYIFQAPDQKSASFDTFKQRVQERVERAPSLKKRLLMLPLDLDAPYLVEDPDFSLGTQISHLGLPHPANREALFQLAADLFQKPLDKSRPLWELTFVSNLTKSADFPNNAFAVISRVHHAIIDEIGDEELMSRLLDFSPQKTQTTTPLPSKKQSQPTGLELLFKSYGFALKSPRKLAILLAKASGTGAKIIAKRAAGNLSFKPKLNRAPASQFERDLSDDRNFAGLRLSLSALKTSRNIYPNASINECLLGIISAGLHKYLQEEGTLPLENLVSLVPFSIKQKTAPKNHKALAQTQQSVDAMLVKLATKDLSIRERIEYIQEQSKAFKSKKNLNRFKQMTEFVPSIYLSLAAKLYTRWNISNLHSSLFNLVITNSPGAQIPMYLGKAQLVETYGSTPIFNGMGLSIVILSYNDYVTISTTSCKNVLAQPQKLLRYIQESFDCLIEQHQPKKPKRKKPAAKNAPARRKKSQA